MNLFKKSHREHNAKYHPSVFVLRQYKRANIKLLQEENNQKTKSHTSYGIQFVMSTFWFSL